MNASTHAGPPRRPPPKFLDLRRIRFPIGALASIGHRVSGVVLVALVPALAAALEQSLRSEADYEALAAMARSGWGTAVLVAAVWAAAHHLFAGVRHLLMDVGVGSSLGHARASAWAAIVLALALAALTALGRLA